MVNNSQVWDRSSPEFCAAWTNQNVELIASIYKEIGEMWKENAAWATIADVFILCKDLYQKTNDIELSLDQPGITKTDISNWSHSLLHTWRDIFSVLKTNSYPEAKPRSGLYIYKNKEHLHFNDWVNVDGISFEMVSKYINSDLTLSQVLSQEPDSSQLQFYNVYLMNDGTYKKNKTASAKNTAKPSANIKVNSLSSDKAFTMNDELQVPVFSEKDFRKSDKQSELTKVQQGSSSAEDAQMDAYTVGAFTMVEEDEVLQEEKQPEIISSIEFGPTID